MAKVQNIWSAFEHTLEDANVKHFRSSIQIQIIKMINKIGLEETAKLINFTPKQLSKAIEDMEFISNNEDEVYSLNDLFQFISKLGIALHPIFATNTSIKDMDSKNGVLDYQENFLK